MLINVFVYSSTQNSISLCSNNQEVGMPYPKAKEFFPDIFSVDDIFSINYEPERGLYHVIRRGEQGDTGLDVPEIIWIKNNFEEIFEVCKNFTENANKDTIEQKRINLLYDTDWQITRHQEQLELQVVTSITNEEYQSLLVYRQYLRDLGGTVSNMSDPWDTITWMENPIHE